MLDDAFVIFIGNFIGEFFTECFKSGNDVQLFSFPVSTGNGAAIHHNSRAVQPAHRDKRTGHVFITPHNGNQRIVIVCTAYGFNRVGYDLATHQRVAHPFRTVADSIAYANGIEDQSHQFIIPYSRFHLLCKFVQVHVAGVAVKARTDDTHLRFGEIVFR